MAEDDAVGMVEEHLQGQPAGFGAEAVAERAGADAQVEDALRTALRQGREGDVAGDAGLVAHRAEVGVVERVEIGLRRTADDGREAGQHSPFRGALGIGRKEARRVMPADRQRERPGPDIPVRLLERRERRQDHVCMARGLVEVHVDADHRVEPGQRRVQPRRAWGGQHRVAAKRDQAVDLTRPWRVDLLGQARGRVLADDARCAAHATGLADQRRVARVRRGQRQVRCDLRAPQRAANGVEVAGQRTHHVDQPRGQRAEGLRAGSDAAVHRGARCRGDLARQRDDGVGRDAAERGDAPGRPVPRQRAQVVDAVDATLQVLQAHAAFGEQHMNHREQQRRVASGAQRDPLVRRLRGAGANGVDHDHSTAARAQGLDGAHHVAVRQDAALGRRRVAAEDDEQVGAVDVGDRHLPHVTVHQVVADVLGQLVDARRRETLREPALPHEQRQVAAGVEAALAHVAAVEGKSVRPVALAHALHELLDALERRGPGGLAPLPAVADHRPAQPIRVVVHVTQHRALGADVPAAEGVVGIGADRDHPLAVVADADAAHALAQRAGTAVHGGSGGGGFWGHAGLAAGFAPV